MSRSWATVERLAAQVGWYRWKPAAPAPVVIYVSAAIEGKKVAESIRRIDRGDERA